MLNLKRKGYFFDILDRQRKDSPKRQKQMLENVMDSRYQLSRMKVWTSKDTCSFGINTISWSTDGQLLVSGSFSDSCSIMNPFTGTAKKIETLSRVLCARFLSYTNSQVVLSSNNGYVMVYDVNAAYGGASPQIFSHGHEKLYVNNVLTVPTHPSLFMSCSTDRTVRLFDLRQKPERITTSNRGNIIIKSMHELEVMSLGPKTMHYIAVGGETDHVNIYDVRYLKFTDKQTVPVQLFDIPSYYKWDDCIASLAYDPDEKYLLANFYMHSVFLYDIQKNNGNILQPPNTNSTQNNRSNILPWDDPKSWLPEKKPQCNSIYLRPLYDDYNTTSERTENNDDNTTSDSIIICGDEDSNDVNNAENSVSSCTTGSSHVENRSAKIAFVQDPAEYIVRHYGINRMRICYKEAAFWGNNHILVCSDNGGVNVWDRHTGKYAFNFSDATEIVNLVQPNPCHAILATAGYRSTVKFWMPLAETGIDEHD